MTRKNTSIGFLAGLFLGVVAAVLLPGRYITPPAMAQAQPQQPPAAATQRYQVSAWAHPGAFGPTGGSQPAEHGAYIIDSLTGEVFLIEGSRAPKAIGRVPTDGREEPTRISDPLRTPQTPPRELRR